MFKKPEGLTTVSIASTSVLGCLRQLLLAEKMGAKAVEIRFDGMNDACRLYFLKNLPLLCHHYPSIRFIITYRLASHGGNGGVTLERSLQFWEYAFYHHIITTHSALFLDWELDLIKFMEQQGINSLGKHQIHWDSILVSQHDFDGTPSESGLGLMLSGALSTKAGAVKIACMSDGPQANERLMKLYGWNISNRPMVVIGMGKEGEQTRRDWRKHHAILGYCFVSEKGGNAPGQLHISEM